MVVAVSLWINIQAVIHPLPIHPQLPISVGRCENTYKAVMKMDHFVPPVAEEWIEPESFSIYQISYMWYTAISVLLSFVVAIPASSAFGHNDPRKMNPKLAARPFDLICWWLPQETRDRLAFDLGADYVSKSPRAGSIYDASMIVDQLTNSISGQTAPILVSKPYTSLFQIEEDDLKAHVVDGNFNMVHSSPISHEAPSGSASRIVDERFWSPPTHL